MSRIDNYDTRQRPSSGAPNCDHCKYSILIIHGSSMQAECRVNPPVMGPVGSQWPQITPADSCGSFKRISVANRTLTKTIREARQEREAAAIAEEDDIEAELDRQIDDATTARARSQLAEAAQTTDARLDRMRRSVFDTLQTLGIDLPTEQAAAVAERVAMDIRQVEIEPDQTELRDYTLD